jgi:hypothetical protein
VKEDRIAAMYGTIGLESVEPAGTPSPVLTRAPTRAQVDTVTATRVPNNSPVAVTDTRVPSESPSRRTYDVLKYTSTVVVDFIPNCDFRDAWYDIVKKVYVGGLGFIVPTESIYIFAEGCVGVDTLIYTVNFHFEVTLNLVDYPFTSAQDMYDMLKADVNKG